MKRLLSFVLSLTLMFLCGCGGNASEKPAASKEKQNLCPVLESDIQYSKLLTEDPLGIDGESYVRLCAGQENIALYGLQPIGGTMGEDQIATDCITMISRETLEQTCYLFDFWADVDPDSGIIAMDFLDETNLLLLFSRLIGDTYAYQFWIYDATDNTFSFLSALNTTRPLDDDVCDIRRVDQRVYISFYYGDILCYDLESKEETILSGTLVSSEFVLSEDGNLYAVGFNGGTVESAPISIGDNSIGTSVPLIDSTWYQVCDGFGDYDFYITYENQICGFSMAEKTLTIVFDRYASGIDLNHVRFFTVDTTLLICDNVTDDFLVDDYMLYTLERQTQEEDQRITLTLATLYTSSDLQESIVEFNKRNSEYVIELRDYSEYGDNGETRLYADIMSGNVPDILNLNGLQETSINSDEYLIDLLPYMQADYGSELDGVQTSVVNALMTGDQLLTNTPNYNLKILCCMESAGPALTTDLFCSLIDQGNEKTMISRDSVMEILFENAWPDLIDPSTNTLDGEQLQKLLSTAKQYPEESETDVTSVKEGLYSGSIRFASTELSSFRSFRQLISELGDEITIYGYPGVSGDAAILEANNYLSITVSSQHPDAAWDFVSTMLTPEIQRKYSHRTFPLTTEVLDELVEEAKASETGFSENAEGLLNELFSSISLGAAQNESIFAIIEEESQSYFAGDKTVEETVNLIQDRVRIYLAEQS